MTRKFIKRFMLFVGLNLTLMAVLLSYIYMQDEHIVLPFGQTESVLNTLREDRHYSLLIMGSSHGRIFSRGPNHTRVQQILHCSMANISRSGAGILPNYLYLKYFYRKGNQADTVLYFVDPFMFSTDKWNEGLYFLADEPFRFDFLPDLFLYHIKSDVVYNYVKSKFLDNWRKTRGVINIDETYQLQYIVPESVRDRTRAMYPDGWSDKNFEKYGQLLMQTLDLAEAHGSHVIFIIPATLLGEQPGMQKLRDFLKSLSATRGTGYYDFSWAIRNSRMYYNHDHLNQRGVDYFTRNYLSKVFRHGDY